MCEGDVRVERDSMGEVEVPQEALWGAQTQRAVGNFPVSGLRLPAGLIHALGLVKSACAKVNGDLGALDGPLAAAVGEAADAVALGEYDDQFPVDVFQTGSGTSSNMNANEVIARLAAQASGLSVHPNDHVNRGQSSNDVFPTAMHVAAALALHTDVEPALAQLILTCELRAQELKDQVKTGRTHLMDAMPVSLGQELAGWAAMLRDNQARLASCAQRLHALALGGTAVGTGVNAHPEFAQRVAACLAERTEVDFRPMTNFFVGLSCQDSLVELSGQLKTLAVSLMKIANDLRWMNSGPLAGLGEIALPALQPGSSIMPGKVNPVIPESVAMVCAQVIGNDSAITVGGQSGVFELNVMLPMIALNSLQSLEILGGAMRVLADKAIAGFEPRPEAMEAALARNPILVTALNERIGYEQGAKIAKQAYAQGRPVLEVALELTDVPREELVRLLDPKRLIGDG